MRTFRHVILRKYVLPHPRHVTQMRVSRVFGRVEWQIECFESDSCRPEGARNYRFDPHIRVRPPAHHVGYDQMHIHGDFQAGLHVPCDASSEPWSWSGEAF